MLLAVGLAVGALGVWFEWMYRREKRTQLRDGDRATRSTEH